MNEIVIYEFKREELIEMIRKEYPFKELLWSKLSSDGLRIRVEK